jgi:hypothetical protein
MVIISSLVSCHMVAQAYILTILSAGLIIEAESAIADRLVIEGCEFSNFWYLFILSLNLLVSKDALSCLQCADPRATRRGCGVRARVVICDPSVYFIGNGTPRRPNDKNHIDLLNPFLPALVRTGCPITNGSLFQGSTAQPLDHLAGK